MRPSRNSSKKILFNLFFEAPPLKDSSKKKIQFFKFFEAAVQRFLWKKCNFFIFRGVHAKILTNFYFFCTKKCCLSSINWVQFFDVIFLQFCSSNLCTIVRRRGRKNWGVNKNKFWRSEFRSINNHSFPIKFHNFWLCPASFEVKKLCFWQAKCMQHACSLQSLLQNYCNSAKKILANHKRFADIRQSLKCDGEYFLWVHSACRLQTAACS